MAMEVTAMETKNIILKLRTGRAYGSFLQGDAEKFIVKEAGR